MKRISHNRKWTFDVVNDFLKTEKRNFKLEKFVNSDKSGLRGLFHCDACQHFWEASIGNVTRRKSGCPKCAGHVPISIAVLQEFMKSIPKIKLITTEQFKATQKIDFHCLDCNKEFKKAATQFMNHPTCPKCSLWAPWDKESIAEWLKNNKPEISIITDKKGTTGIDWQCNKCDNIWTTSFGHIRHTSGCPKCNFSGTLEIAVRLLLEKTFNFPFPKIRPNWLKNPETGANLELDCYNQELNLAVEINGLQHYKYIPKAHKTEEDFLSQQRRDIFKREQLQKLGINLIEISTYNKKRYTVKNFLKAELLKLGYNLPPEFDDWDLRNFHPPQPKKKRKKNTFW